MESRPGCFIVIEGTDGSGKGTQFNLLVEALEKEGYDVAAFDFPRYDQPSSHFVRKYLNGDYGTAEEVGPYTGSLFYALDRYEAAPQIKQALSDGKIVLANRFTGSNMAHQGTKFNNDAERNGYFVWLDAIEFQMLGIPRPDVSLVLRVPAATAQNLVDKKEARSYTDKKRDLHEADLSHLEKSVQVYDDLCKTFPKDFKALDCVRDGKLMSIEAVQKLVRETVDPLLPAKKSTKLPKVVPKPSYAIPDLDEETKAQYTTLMDRITVTYTDMYNQLSAQNKDAKALLAPVLPLATQSEYIINDAIEPLDESIANAFSSDMLPIHLVKATPRNEFSIIPDMLYESSGLSVSEINQSIEQWNYEKKANVFTNYLDTSESRTALESIRYDWDIVSDYVSIARIANALQLNVVPQTLTPRYGYEVPTAIIDAGLSDAYENCFDTSLKLYSILQSAGYAKEAQLTTLLGHRMRARLSCTAYDLWQLQASDSSDLLTLLQQKTAEVHPLTAEYFSPEK